jgi:hypothetical protein
MGNEALLAQLKDIHLPQRIGWWPLAPGWYFVLIIVVICIGELLYVCYKHYKNTRVKKQALVLLQGYVSSYEHHQNASQLCADIGALLKRVSLVYYPRAKVAGMYGADWVDFLSQTSHGIDFKSIQHLLLVTPFQSKATDDIRPLIVGAQRWIKQRKKPCLN